MGVLRCWGYSIPCFSLDRLSRATGTGILIGARAHALNIFETSLRFGKLDESRVLSCGSLIETTKARGDEEDP